MYRVTPLLFAAIALGLGACSSDGDLVPPTPDGAGFKVGNPYLIDGVRYVPKVDPEYDETGIASWYGKQFHGKATANGETYDMEALTAAHKTLPMPSRVRVTSLENDKELILRVNDRGPFVGDRIIDVSRRAARELGFMNKGTARVRVEVLDSPAFAAAKTPAVPKAKRVRPADEPSAATTAAAASDKPRPRRLFVQAGSFAIPENAYRLSADLRRVAAFTVTPLQTQNGLLHRVRAGPLWSTAEVHTVLSGLRAVGFTEARLVHH